MPSVVEVPHPAHAASVLGNTHIARRCAYREMFGTLPKPISLCTANPGRSTPSDRSRDESLITLSPSGFVRGQRDSSVAPSSLTGPSEVLHGHSKLGEKGQWEAKKQSHMTCSGAKQKVS